MKELDKEQKEYVRELIGEAIHNSYRECMNHETHVDDIQKNFLKEKGLLEQEFEVGKWYKIDGTSFMIHITKLSTINNMCDAYGLGKFDDWWDESEFGTKGITPATDKEVEEDLIKEAKRRYKKGDKIIWEEYWNEPVTIKLKNLSYNTNENTSHHNGLWCNGYQIFQENNGKWAEIVEEKNEDAWEKHARGVEASDILMKAIAEANLVLKGLK